MPAAPSARVFLQARIWLGRSSCGLQCDAVTQSLEPPAQALLNAGAVAFVEVVGSQVVIRLFFGQHVVSNDKNGMRDSDQGFLLPPASRKSTILSSQVCILGAACAVGRLHQGGPQPRTTLTNLT